MEIGVILPTSTPDPTTPILDGTIVLAAGATTRVTLGFGVMLPALCPVAWAAKQIASLQYVSGNRLILGAGIGNPAHGDLACRAALPAV